MKIQKGEPGYIKAQKTKLLIWTVAEFGIVIALVVLGYIQTGSKLNLLTVVAILGCLPAAKMLVEFIAMAPHKSIDPDKYKEIMEKAPLVTKVCDTIITGNDKIMPVEMFVISGHTVFGYTSSPKTDEVKTARYLKEMFHNNHIDKVTVKVLHDYKAFLARAEGMNNIMMIDQPDNRKKERKIRQLILTTSM